MCTCTLQSTYTYTAYHSVCPLVGIGTMPPPLSPASVPLPPEPKGGEHTRLWVREGLRERQFRRLEKCLALCLLCGVPDAPHVEDDRSLEVRVRGADREAGRGAGGGGRVTRLSQGRQRLQFFSTFYFYNHQCCCTYNALFCSFLDIVLDEIFVPSRYTCGLQNLFWVTFRLCHKIHLWKLGYVMPFWVRIQTSLKCHK
jgi:hypothetical protein